MSKRKFTSVLRQVQNEDLVLFDAKNKDYGDSFRKFGLVGLLTRMSDKIDRATHITSTSVILVEGESLNDTIRDLRIYCTMYEALRRSN